MCFIYGPGGLPIEQISSTGTVTYLHRDQQGSTRLMTGSSGTVEGKCSYSAYGTRTCEGTATTSLGYDAQYTSSDTGLVYMRNRVYDPSTAQFLSVDPAVSITQEPYVYAADNPVNLADPTGLEAIPLPAPVPGGCAAAPEVCGAAAAGGVDVWLGIKVFNSVAGSEGGDEGEAGLHEREAQRASECGEPNPGNLEKLSEGEIERILDDEGSDIHTDKRETAGEHGSAYDYYRDMTTGEIYLVPKAGGESIPTGLGR